LTNIFGTLLHVYHSEISQTGSRTQLINPQVQMPDKIGDYSCVSLSCYTNNHTTLSVLRGPRQSTAFHTALTKIQEGNPAGENGDKATQGKSKKKNLKYRHKPKQIKPKLEPSPLCPACLLLQDSCKRFDASILEQD
jgi:hypothetical protein